MKVNFDGMRKNATDSMNELRGVLDDIITEFEDEFTYSDTKLIIDTFNKAAMEVSIFNCLSSEEDDVFEELDITINKLEERE